MKKLIFISFFLFSVCAFAQVSESFSDAESWTDRWSGDTDKFIVNDDEQLQSNAGQLAAAGSYYVSTPSTLANDCEWSFWVNLIFSISGANYVDIYLVANTDNMTANSNGYFVRVGGTNAPVTLYKRTGTASTAITALIAGVNGDIAQNRPMKIKVIRNADNSWKMQFDKTGTGNAYTVTRTAPADASPLLTSTNMGILIQQSTAAGPANNHFFDDIYAGEIIPDTDAPFVSSVSMVAGSNNQVQVVFSEPVAPVSVDNFNLASDEKPTAADLSADQQSVVLTFATIFSSGTSYTLFINNISDLAGNQLDASATGYPFGKVEAPSEKDLIINEIMFDCAADSEDYIEIYNKSNNFLDLTGLRFVKTSTATPSVQAIPANLIIAPQSYMAFVAHPDALREFFDVPDYAVIQITNFASGFFTNSGATIQLNDGTTVFDELTYSPKMHSPLISNTKGVALERINPNLPTNDASNWHSAAFNVHWGTPGYQNSQFSDDTSTITGKRVWAEPKNFTPDNDGDKDFTNIYFSSDDIGFFATVFVYDALGRKLRTLANNQLISPDAFIRWDGTDDNGKIVNVGIYAIYAEIIRTDGKREQFKFPCVVSAVKR